MNSDPNPYSAPASAVQESTPAGQAAPALWNPNAAAAWSLLFSPVFGGYLQMRNWQALGDTQKAQVSWYWCIGSLVAIIVLVVISVMLPDGNPLQRIIDRSGIIILLAWYVSHGKLQPAYVKEHFGKDYPRKGWGAPLGIAFAAIAAFLVAMFLLGIVLVILRGGAH
jgi:hypothetical protein